MFNYYTLYYLILITCIASIALLAPSLSKHSLAVTPESFKTAWGVAGVFFILALWVLNNGLKDKVIMLKSTFYYPIAGFIVWCCISFAWVIDGYLATVQLVQFISIALAFFIVVNSFRGTKEIKQLLCLMVIMAMLVSILGLLQYYFPSNLNIQTFIRQAVKPAATFGNKNMAIHFIVMTLPLSIIFLLRAKTIATTVFFTLATILLSWFLIHSYTRAGWLSVAVELFFLLLFIGYDYRKNNHNPFILSGKPSATLLITFMAIFTIIILAIMSYYQQGELALFFILLLILIALISVLIHLKKTAIKLLPFHKIIIMLMGVALWFSAINYTVNGFQSNITKVATRLASITPAQAKQDGNERLAAWVNTIEMIKEHPVVGVGVGQWPTYYPLYYDSAVKDRIFNEKVRLRHLHNEYLELLANVGIVGFALLLWLLYLTVRTAYRLLINPQTEERYLVLGMVLSLTGFAVTSIFTFPIKVYAPLLFAMIYIALMVNMDFRATGDGKGATGITNKQKKHHIIGDSNQYFVLHQSLAPLLLIISLILTVAMAYVSYRWILGEHHYHNASALKDKRKNKKRLVEIRKSILYNPYRARALVVAGNAYIANQDNKTGIDYLQKSLTISPYQTNTMLSLSQLYLAEKDSDNQINTLAEVIRIDPRNVRAYARLTVAYARKKNAKKASESYQLMKESFEYFKDRNQFGPYYNEVGKVAERVKDYQYTKYIFAAAIKRYPDNAEYYKNLGSMLYYHSQNEAEKTKGIALLKRALALNPKISQHQRLLQIIHNSGAT